MVIKGLSKNMDFMTVRHIIESLQKKAILKRELIFRPERWGFISCRGQNSREPVVMAFFSGCCDIFSFMMRVKLRISVVEIRAVFPGHAQCGPSRPDRDQY
jgi:hypothetical protein